jgi:hypothetical protein
MWRCWLCSTMRMNLVQLILLRASSCMWLLMMHRWLSSNLCLFSTILVLFIQMRSRECLNTLLKDWCRVTSRTSFLWKVVILIMNLDTISCGKVTCHLHVMLLMWWYWIRSCHSSHRKSTWVEMMLLLKSSMWRLSTNSTGSAILFSICSVPLLLSLLRRHLVILIPIWSRTLSKSGWIGMLRTSFHMQRIFTNKFACSLCRCACATSCGSSDNWRNFIVLETVIQARVLNCTRLRLVISFDSASQIKIERFWLLSLWNWTSNVILILLIIHKLLILTYSSIVCIWCVTADFDRYLVLKTCSFTLLAMCLLWFPLSWWRLAISFFYSSTHHNYSCATCASSGTSNTILSRAIVFSTRLEQVVVSWLINSCCCVCFLLGCHSCCRICLLPPPWIITRLLSIVELRVVCFRTLAWRW